MNQEPKTYSLPSFIGTCKTTNEQIVFIENGNTIDFSNILTSTDNKKWKRKAKYEIKGNDI